MINQKGNLSTKKNDPSVEEIKQELDKLKKETIEQLKEILNEIENLDE